MLCLAASIVLLIYRMVRWLDQSHSSRPRAEVARLFRPMAGILLSLGLGPQVQRSLNRAMLFQLKPLDYLSRLLLRTLLYSCAATVFVFQLTGAPLALFFGLVVLIASPIMALQRLERRWHQQRWQVRRELPFVLDLFVMSIESGAGLQSSLQHVYEVMPPNACRLILGRCLSELQAGVGRRQAMRQMSDTLELDEMQQWVQATEHAEDFGLSLGPLLRIQASQIRDKLVQDGERRALQAPIKMLVPLTLCLLPCSFLILLLALGSQFAPLLNAH